MAQLCRDGHAIEMTRYTHSFMPQSKEEMFVKVANYNFFVLRFIQRWTRDRTVEEFLPLLRKIQPVLEPIVGPRHPLADEVAEALLKE